MKENVIFLPLFSILRGFLRFHFSKYFYRTVTVTVIRMSWNVRTFITLNICKVSTSQFGSSRNASLYIYCQSQYLHTNAFNFLNSPSDCAIQLEVDNLTRVQSFFFRVVRSCPSVVQYCSDVGELTCLLESARRSSYCNSPNFYIF
jgi:hypothetical protein